MRRRMKELFKASRDSLGSRTLGENLRDEGFKTGRDRTRRLMKTLNLKVKQKRKYKVTTDSKHHLPVAENVLNRSSLRRHPIRRGVWILRICDAAGLGLPGGGN